MRDKCAVVKVARDGSKESVVRTFKSMVPALNEALRLARQHGSQFAFVVRPVGRLH